MKILVTQLSLIQSNLTSTLFIHPTTCTRRRDSLLSLHTLIQLPLSERHPVTKRPQQTRNKLKIIKRQDNSLNDQRRHPNAQKQPTTDQRTATTSRRNTSPRQLRPSRRLPHRRNCPSKPPFYSDPIFRILNIGLLQKHRIPSMTNNKRRQYYQPPLTTRSDRLHRWILRGVPLSLVVVLVHHVPRWISSSKVNRRHPHHHPPPLHHHHHHHHPPRVRARIRLLQTLAHPLQWPGMVITLTSFHNQRGRLFGIKKIEDDFICKKKPPSSINFDCFCLSSLAALLRYWIC